MRKRVAEILMTIAKILPFVVMLALVALYLPNKDAVSVDSILRYTPDNLWAGRPGGAGGLRRQIPVRLFPPAGAVRGGGAAVPPARCPFGQSVRPAGVCHRPLRHRPLCGQGSGGQPAEKYKKIARINEIKRGSELFFAFFLRIIAVLPGDVVSMVLGASGMTYWKFAVGSLLGLLPVMVATTVARLLPVRSHLPGVHRHGGAGGASVGGIFRPLADGQPEKRGFRPETDPEQ